MKRYFNQILENPQVIFCFIISLGFIIGKLFGLFLFKLFGY